MYERNEKLFAELRNLNLPSGEFVIVASGPLGIRGLREMRDVDVLVSDELWKELEQRYPEFHEHEAFKLKLSENVEVLSQASFGGRNVDGPSAAEQIANAEIIDGLPFQDVQTALFFKKRSEREKDQKDVELLMSWIKKQ